MSITDELRLFAADPYTGWVPTDKQQANLRAIADRIDAEHEAMLVDARKTVYQGYIELPKDADGEYIRVGDRLDGYGKTIEVVEMRHGRSGWVLISRDGNGYADTFAFTHHHAPTVEDVLREFADAMNENLGMYTGEVIDADEWREADRKTIADFAVKLRLAGGDE